MIRSTLVLLAFLVQLPVAHAQPDDEPIDPADTVSDYGRRLDDGSSFGAAGAFEPGMIEEVRAGALGRVFPAEGVIATVDFSGPAVLIDGLRYDFAPDATVILLSGYGAPTLLQSGMSARFIFESTDDAGTIGRIHRLEEVEAAPTLEH